MSTIVSVSVVVVKAVHVVPSSEVAMLELVVSWEEVLVLVVVEFGKMVVELIERVDWLVE